MANPSSSHHDRDRDRERVRERSHHHHRTISSTTLLLTLSLILAVLAVMLSLPSNRGGSSVTAPTTDGAPHTSGFWNMLTPRRTDTLVAREVAVAKREGDVARREADLLAGALISCGPYATVTEHIETIGAPPPAQTIYKEIIKEREPSESALTVQQQQNTAELTRRIEDLLAREAKVAEREKDMSRREEIVNRREHDASRRENWIMEQLIALGNDPQTIEEEYIYEPAAGTKRKVKDLPLPTSTILSVTTQTQTVTSTVSPPAPPPANTRPAAYPTPQSYADPTAPGSLPTKVVEVVVDEVPVPEETDLYDDEEEVVRPRTVIRKGPPRSKRWAGW